jgi:hypothetical protein
MTIAKTHSQSAKAVAAQKPCQKMTEAIVVDGGKRGKIVRVCADPSCRIHHGQRPSPQTIERERAEERKRIENAEHRAVRHLASAIQPSRTVGKAAQG